LRQARPPDCRPILPGSGDHWVRHALAGHYPLDRQIGAEFGWRSLLGTKGAQLPKLITGVKFIDGIEAVSQQPLAA
jgi:hypothetical protein